MSNIRGTGSYSSSFQSLMQLILHPRTDTNGKRLFPDITYNTDGTVNDFWYSGSSAFHGGVDFNFSDIAGNHGSTNNPGDQFPVYAPVTGTVVALQPAIGGVIIQSDVDGTYHRILHLDTTLVDTTTNNRVTAGATPIGRLGSLGADAVHVHYDVFLESNETTGWQAPIGDVDQDLRIDPIVYWTRGVNPYANNINSKGLHVFATPVNDYNDDGSIETSSNPSESAGFIREGEASVIAVGVNTPHTQELKIQILFSERPATLTASALRGVNAVSWVGNSLFVTLTATATQSTPNTVGYVRLNFGPESDTNNTRSEVITYSVLVDGPAGAAFSSGPERSLFLLDNDAPTPALDPGTLQESPQTWDGSALRRGTDQNNNASIAGVGAGHPDFIDFTGDGINDNGAIQGTAGGELVHGNAGDDEIYGNGGGDALYGDEGNDKLYAFNINASDFAPAYLNGGSGSDDLHGAGGSDQLIGSPDQDTGVTDDDVLDGRAGDDILQGGVGRDILIGGEGDDHLNGGPEEDPGIENPEIAEGDALQGGEGDDTLLGGFGNDVLFGGTGHDVLKGGKGNDHLRGAATSRALNRDWDATDPGDAESGQVNFFDFSGNPDDPEDLSPIFGSPTFADDGDAMFGEDGHDMLVGGAGDDYLDGGEDNDSLLGNIGNDVLYGGAGVDALVGHEGDDQLFGGAGGDFLFGDGTIIEYTSGYSDAGLPGHDVLDGGSGDDELNGGGGNDTYLFGLDYGQDVVDDDEGRDIIRLGSGILPSGSNGVTLMQAGNLADVTLTLNASVSDGGAADRLTLRNWTGYGRIEYIQFEDGTVWDQTVISQRTGLGTEANNILNVTDLDLYQSGMVDGVNVVATLFGADGDDTLTGSSFRDVLYGGADNDLIDGAGGTDTMVGGVGNDTYVADNLNDVAFENPNAGIDTVESASNYTLSANVENLTLTGVDSINGIGNAHDNIIIGNSANNLLIGDIGDDVIEGGEGDDTLLDGAGDDTYLYNFGDGVDTIIDADGMGRIIYRDADGVEHVLAGGTRSSVDENVYESSDGRFSYRIDGRSLALTLDGQAALAIQNYNPSLASLGIALDPPPVIDDGGTDSILAASTAADGTFGNGFSGSPSLSADSRYVAFNSVASNLVSGDTNNQGDIFVKDLQTGAVTRVNTAADGTQANSISAFSSISADGRYVAFGSAASNLVAGDTNNKQDIFVKDRQTGAVTRVTTALFGAQPNNFSQNPSMSTDGRYVAFHSLASNLVAGDTNNADEIFVKDLQTGTLTRVSTTASGGQANNFSNTPSISGDGRYVAFVSPASNLVAGDTNNQVDIFVKDLQTGAITRVNTAADGTQADRLSIEAKISGNGRYVVFGSNATNLVPGDTNSPSGAPFGGTSDIFVKDLQTGAITRASLAATARRQIARVAGRPFQEMAAMSRSGATPQIW